jgi:dTDP-4-dehydrorhamnose 3,5-epimerase
MQVTELGLEGVKLILPDLFHDDRGFFMESYNPYKYIAAGIDTPFIQDNHSQSREGVIRGLHFQLNPWQVKLVRVVQGIIWDVVVDVRPDSPTFGKWVGEHLSSANYRQMFIPAGCAHGFSVLTHYADVVYKVNVPYNSNAEQSIAFDDPELNIDWKVELPVVSERDRNAMSFDDYKRMLVS